MSEHTPGPLTVVQNTNTRYKEAGDCAIIDDAGKIIGEAFVLVAENTRRPALANATLWAAAHALLEACERVYRVAIDADLPGPVHLSIEERNLLRYAIARARGTQP